MQTLWRSLACYTVLTFDAKVNERGCCITTQRFIHKPSACSICIRWLDWKRLNPAFGDPPGASVIGIGFIMYLRIRRLHRQQSWIQRERNFGGCVPPRKKHKMLLSCSLCLHILSVRKPTCVLSHNRLYGKSVEPLSVVVIRRTRTISSRQLPNSCCNTIQSTNISIQLIRSTSWWWKHVGEHFTCLVRTREIIEPKPLQDYCNVLRNIWKTLSWAMFRDSMMCRYETPASIRRTIASRTSGSTTPFLIDPLLSSP